MVSDINHRNLFSEKKEYLVLEGKFILILKFQVPLKKIGIHKLLKLL